MQRHEKEERITKRERGRKESKGKRTEVNSEEEYRRETNKVLKVEHRSVLSKLPVHPRSSIIEGMPGAILLPTQSQCQQHCKYQHTLNRFFKDLVKVDSDQWQRE